MREVRSSGCRKEGLKPHSVLWEPSEPQTLQLVKEFVLLRQRSAVSVLVLFCLCSLELKGKAGDGHVRGETLWREPWMEPGKGHCR